MKFLQSLVQAAPGFMFTITVMPVGSDVTVAITPAALTAGGTTASLTPFTSTYTLENVDELMIADVTSIFTSPAVASGVEAYAAQLAGQMKAEAAKKVSPPPATTATATATPAAKTAPAKPGSKVAGPPAKLGTVATPPAAKPAEAMTDAVEYTTEDENHAEHLADQIADTPLAEAAEVDGDEVDLDW